MLKLLPQFTPERKFSRVKLKKSNIHIDKVFPNTRFRPEGLKVCSHIFFWKLYWFAFYIYVWNSIFVYDVEWGSSLIIFHMDTQLLGHHLWNTVFPQCSAVPTLSSSICLYVHKFVSGISGTLICLLLYQNHSLNYCYITISLDVF